MKKQKFNWLLNIATIALCVCAIAIGVYSAKQASLSISGTIGFTANNCDVFVYAKIEGAATKDENGDLTQTTKEFGTENSYVNIHDNKESWNIGQLYFDDMNDVPTGIEANDIVITIKMYNASVFNVDVSANTNFLADCGLSDYVDIDFSSEMKILSANQTISDATTITTTISLKSGATNFDVSSITATFISFAKAEEYSYEDYAFTTDDNTKTATIVGYYGPATTTKIPPIYIDDAGNQYTVTSIGMYAFEGHTSLISVTIPSSVTSIVENAFYYCRGLTSVTIPSSVTRIGGSAFYGCCRLIEVVNKSNLEITAGSSDYGNVAYYAKQVITDEKDSKLTTDANGFVIYNESDTSKILVAYQGTETNITIPSGITEINQYAFYDCSSTSITIPSSVTRIGGSAFYECSRLIEVVNKSNLEITAGRSDYGYVAYYAKQVITDEKDSKLTTDANGFVIYNESDTSKILVAYQGTETNITIPSEITEINQYAFYQCTNLTSVTIPSSVTSIGDSAFVNCTNLTSVTIPNTVTSIGMYAFSNCSSLTSVTFEVITGWKAGTSSLDGKISSTDLAANATLLTNTYVAYAWTRS